MKIKLGNSIEEGDAHFVDKLNRDEEIENLSQVLLSIKHPLVLALNSAWGTGKTTFVHMWRSKLMRRGSATMYFNAWEAELLADPLVAITTEIARSIRLEGGMTQSDLAALDKLSKVAGRIVSRGFPALLKKLSGDLIDLDEDAQEAIGNVLGRSAEDVIDDYKSGKSDSSRLKTLLVKTMESRVDKGPLIIFIDELDRCKPSYAIKLLERVKHIFEIPGLQFVVSLDTTQLQHSVKVIYGEGFDAKRYLRRFFDIEYSLLESNTKDFLEDIWTSYDLPAIADNTVDEKEDVLNFFCDYGPELGTSLRDLEQILGQVRIAHELTIDMPAPALYLQSILLLIYSQDTGQDDTLDLGNTLGTAILPTIERLLDHHGWYDCAIVAIAAAIVSEGESHEILERSDYYDFDVSRWDGISEDTDHRNSLKSAIKVFAQSVFQPGSKFDLNLVFKSVKFALRTK